MQLAIKGPTGTIVAHGEDGTILTLADHERAAALKLLRKTLAMLTAIESSTGRTVAARRKPDARKSSR
jgi:hypothetical protein